MDPTPGPSSSMVASSTSGAGDAQPNAHAPRTRGTPLARSHAKTTPSAHRAPACAQIGGGGSDGRTGRCTGEASGGAQSCDAAASTPTISTASPTHRGSGHASTRRHGHAHADPLHGCGTYPASDASTCPPTQRRRPGEQSDPASPPPKGEDDEVDSGDAPVARSRMERAQLRSHAAVSAASAATVASSGARREGVLSSR